jgi:PAS domain-containing protein
MMQYDEGGDLGPLGLLHALELRNERIERLERELARTRAELETTQNRYADIYDASPTAQLTLSPAGHILEANLAAAALFGLERALLIGQSIDEWVEDSTAGTWEVVRPDGEVACFCAERIPPLGSGPGPEWAAPRRLVLSEIKDGR